MRICIDPGHGGSDPGAIGLVPQPLEEKELTLDVSLLLRQEIQDLGHEVIMTRQQDQTRSLAERAAFANQFNADLFISIHANAAANSTSEGIEVFHFAGSALGNDLASRVLDSLIAEFPDHSNRGVKEADFAVLRLTSMPAILVECEFLTNPNQLLFLSAPANRGRIAAAIARGMGTHNIEVILRNGEVATKREDNPRAGVARGNTVVWSFKVEVEGQKQVASVIEQNLDVFFKNPSSSSAFDVPPSPVQGHPDQISGHVSLAFEGNEIEYDIRKDKTPLLWADREVTRLNGGCMKPIIPPTQ